MNLEINIGIRVQLRPDKTEVKSLGIKSVDEKYGT